jgi:hypothetical protein
MHSPGDNTLSSRSIAEAYRRVAAGMGESLLTKVTSCAVVGLGAPLIEAKAHTGGGLTSNQFFANLDGPS